MLSKKQANKIASLFNEIQVSESMATNGNYDFDLWWKKAAAATVTLHEEFGITLPTYENSKAYLAN